MDLNDGLDGFNLSIRQIRIRIRIRIRVRIRIRDQPLLI